MICLAMLFSVGSSQTREARRPSVGFVEVADTTAGARLRCDHPQKPGLGVSRRDHPGAHPALRHAAAEPALYRRHARQEFSPHRRARITDQDADNRRPSGVVRCRIVESRNAPLAAQDALHGATGRVCGWHGGDSQAGTFDRTPRRHSPAPRRPIQTGPAHPIRFPPDLRAPRVERHVNARPRCGAPDRSCCIRRRRAVRRMSLG